MGKRACVHLYKPHRLGKRPVLAVLQALRAQGVPFVQLNPGGTLQGSRRTTARWATPVCATNVRVWLMVPTASLELVRTVALAEGVEYERDTLARRWRLHVRPFLARVT